MKKILSILVMVLFGVGALYSQGSVTVYAYANVNTKSQSNLGGGQVQAHAASREWTSASEWNSGTIGSSSSIVGYEARLTKYGPYYKVSYSADAYPDNGYYFSHWLNENGETLTGKGDAKNGIKDIEHSWVGSGNTNVHVYAIFKPVTVTGAGTVTNISTTDLGGVGTGTVTFNVANADDGKDFTASIEGDAGFKIIEEPTWTDNVVTITIQYTDQNKHGTNIASTKVTLTSKGDPNSKATATIYATSNLTPTFTKPADYNYGTIYANDILSSEDNLHVITKNHAASQASPAATWTASLSGTNSNQFQLVNANPQYGAFEVIYKPTEVGTHTATLSISVTYTDAKGTTIPSGEPKIVTLTGRAEQPTISAIVFNPTAVDFNEQVTGYTGSQKVTVSQQNVANVEYSWGETNAANVFSYAIAAGSVTISANPTAPGTYTATLTATGDDTRDGQTGNKTIGILPVSVIVGLASPVLTGGSNLTDTYYLTWNTVPYASTYTIYEVSGENKTDITSTVTYVVNESDTKTVSIPANSTSEKTFVIKAEGTYEDDVYTAWSNDVTVKLNVLTPTGIPYLEIYTGTDRTDLSDFTKLRNAVRIPRKKVNLINTFDVNGKPLFDELYVFGETVLTSGSTKFSPATTTQPNNAVTPCYVFTKTADGYKLIPGENGGPTIGNVNQAEKPLPNTTDRCWTIAAGDNKKLYFTGFCPFGSNGWSKDDEGIVYIKGAAGASVDVYLEDCQLYSRQHTTYGNSLSNKDMSVFDVSPFSSGAYPSKGSASAMVLECTSDNNSTNPFVATIHTIGESVLYAEKGSSGYAKILTEEAWIGQYSASLYVRASSKSSYCILNFDDKWPTDATNYESHKRTNGYLRFQKPSTNSPSIDIGNTNTVVNFNGGQIELQNSAPASPYYLNSLAICCRLGSAEIYSIPINVGLGMGGDDVGGEVNFNDGTVNALKFKPKTEHLSYFDVDAEGYSYTLRCPERTYITGGSHNSDVRACSAVDKSGGSPKDKKGNTLVKLDYQLPGTANIQVDNATGLVIPSSMPNQLTCEGCGEGGSNTVLDLEEYGKQSLCPDATNYIHLWAPGAGRIEYDITSWILCMTGIKANSGIGSVNIGGNQSVPSAVTNKVNNLLYAQIDQDMYTVLSNDYQVPAMVPGTTPAEYKTIGISEYGEDVYSNILNSDPYTIYERIYYVRAVVADEWLLFSPPFDVSNMYVLESSSEEALETQTKNDSRDAALATQAEYNMDLASILAASIVADMSANSNRTFEQHYNNVLTYASSATNKKKESYRSFVNKVRLNPFTGSNYERANFFIYESEDAIWNFTNGQFTTDWRLAEPIEKTIGETTRDVIMQAGKIYALQFPFCPKCEGYDEHGELNPRTFWDYWTGKFIIFEGFGPQTIAGTSAHTEMQTFANAYATDSVGQLVGNPVFAEFEVTPTDKTYFCDSYNDLQHDGEDNIMKAGDVFMLAKLPPALQGLQRKVDFETGSITWEEDNSNDGTTTSTPTISGNRQMMVYTIDGGVGVIPVTAQQVSIYNAAGQLITSQYLTEEVQIPLPAGIYLISGEKEQAKAIVR